MGPRGLGPKTIKLWKSLKIMKISVFVNMEKMRIAILRREHWTTAPDHWYVICWSKLCFWKFVKKVSKVLKFDQFWVQAVCLTTRLRRVIGCLQTRWLDASKPLVLAGAVPSGGFFSVKKASTNQIMRIYYNIYVFVCFPKKNFVVSSFCVSFHSSSLCLLLFLLLCLLLFFVLLLLLLFLLIINISSAS